MSKKVKQFHVRIPEELHTWIKENIKDKTINDFIVGLIETHIETLKHEEKPQNEADKPIEVSDQIKALVQVHVTILRERYENWMFCNAFRDLERYIIDCDFTLNADENPDDWRTKVGEKLLKEYFEPVSKLSDVEKGILYEEIKNEEERLQKQRLFTECDGDPEKIVYKTWTRKDIYGMFYKDVTVNVMNVAEHLGLTYMDCYNHIVPWMKHNGFPLFLKI